MATNGLFTSGQIFNGTIQRITYSGQHRDWSGGTGVVPYPANVNNGERNSFLHLSADESPARSAGGFVYNGVNDNGKPIQWIVAWDNTVNVPNNKVYTEVRAPTKVEWNVIAQRMVPNQKSFTYDGCLANVSITNGDFPEILAVLSQQSISNN